MSDEVRHLLRRGSKLPQLSWGFEEVWQRSQRLRLRRLAAGVASTAAIIAVATFGVTSITWTRGADERGNRIAPAESARWQPIPDAPIKARLRNPAVWTGEEMVIWGGGVEDAQLVDGAAFDPDAQEWRILSDGPLEFSSGRTAVWTGQEMLLWGGEVGDGGHGRPDNGAAYDPNTDTWTELPRAPHWSLAGHSAIWTGEEMVVWGGVGMENQGAALAPRSGGWKPIAPAPIDGRHGHTAVWTGTEMIVWGGRSSGGGGLLTTAAAYDPVSDSWRELPPAPVSKRDLHAAVWTGEEMIVWGGWSEDTALSDGAAYNPASNSWRELPPAPIGAGDSDTVDVWTGREMIVVGANGDLAAYSPAGNEWTKLPEPPSGAVMSPTLVRAEDRLILWGGVPARNVGWLPNQGALLYLDG